MRAGGRSGFSSTAPDVLAATSLALALLGTLGASSGWTVIPLLVLCAGCIAALLFAARAAGGYDSFAAIFMGFFALYGLSGPLNAVIGLEKLPRTIAEPHETAIFLMQLGLALAGFIAGLFFIHRLAGRPGTVAADPSSIWSMRSLPLLYAGLALAALAGGFELINFSRAGGWSTILQGKAAYQSRVADLVLTLPSQIVSYFAVAAIALFIAHDRRMSGRPRGRTLAAMTAFLVLLAPLLLTTIVLTRRTEIVAWILIVFVGTAWFSRVRRVTVTIMALALAAYVGSAALLSARAEFQSFRFAVFTDRVWWDNFRLFINPGVGEFGAPFAVASEYAKKAAAQPNRWGRTYLDGIASAVPGFLWPGAKPRPVDMEVRDRLFPSYRGGAAIESPGFSPILEAQMNFGKIGIFALFAIFGAAAGGFELLRKGALPLAMLYLTLLPIAQTFHRSAFGPAVISVASMTAGVLFVFCLIYYPIAFRFRRAGIRAP